MHLLRWTRLWIVLIAWLSMTTASLFAAEIAVIHGRLSAPANEQGFATSLARHVQRWYADVGVSADLYDDTNPTLALSGKRLAVLVYCAQLSSGQLKALRQFTDRGGKLIVFYSSSQGLAQLMGLRVGGYTKAATAGRWSKMLFAQGRPAGTPPVIKQTSPNLFTATALPNSGARILAQWYDLAGRKMPEAAWFATPKGYWMTHVLSGGGDEDAKKMLLLALTAQYVPGVWNAAAHSLYNDATKPLTDGSLRKRIRSIPSGTRRKSLDRNYSAIIKQSAQVRTLFARNGGPSLLAQVKQLRNQIYQVYGETFFAKPGEIVGVWDHSGRGLYPGDWPRTCQELASAGITDLYVNVAGAGFAHYPSRILPVSPVVAQYGDQLAASTTAAAKYGIRVHAWILLYSTTGATPSRMEIFKKQGWTLQDVSGKSRPWLDPANPTVRNYLTQASVEMAKHYRIAGVHLDFVRYPSFNDALGPRSRAAFEKAIGKRMGTWPQAVTDKGAMREPFIRWRTERVTDTVSQIRRALRTARPSVKLSVAVYGKYPSCIASVGQDWQSWQRMGLVDQIAPMNYTHSMSSLNEWLSQQTSNKRNARQIISGIGITAAESRLTPIEMLNQIALIRSKGCSGFILFDLDDTLSKSFLPILRAGVTRTTTR